MNNLYLIYGDEDYLIKKEVDNIINNYSNIIRYNLNTVNISDILLEASTVSMFDENKVIVLDDCDFLTGESKKDIDHDITSLLKYINNPFEDVILVFIVRKEKLDERKKIVKELKKLSKVINVNKLDSHNLSDYIYNYFKNNGYEITFNLVNVIINKVKYDLSNIINECDKLMLYKDSDKVITMDDINDVVIEHIEDNIFELTNSILNKDIGKSIKIYNDLLLKGEEPIKLITMISNQFRLILQVKLMVKNDYRQDSIPGILKEHPYRVKLALTSNYSIKELKDNIKKLYKLDYDIKSGNIDKNLGLELFLINV